MATPQNATPYYTEVSRNVNMAMAAAIKKAAHKDRYIGQLISEVINASAKGARA